MPARSPQAPGALPGRFTRFSGFPEREIHGVILAFVDLDAGTSVHCLKRAPAQFAIILVAIDTVVHIAVNYIGRFFVNELLDHLDDLGHIFGGTRIYRGRFDVEGFQIALIAVDVLLGEQKGIHSQVICFVDDLVIYIGKIHDITYIIALVFQVAAGDIED